MAKFYGYPVIDPDGTVWECAGVRRLLPPVRCAVCDVYRALHLDAPRWPGHDGHTDCRYRDHRYGRIANVGSIASGGTVAHCRCYVCFTPAGQMAAPVQRATFEAQA